MIRKTGTAETSGITAQGSDTRAGLAGAPRSDRCAPLHSPGLVSELERRVRRGEHLALYGPRGAGKSAILKALEARLMRAGIPYGLSPSTTSLDDITRALERAYPGVPTSEVARRAARSRLWLAADERRGVLLLDHLTEISNAMVGFLRRLHGGLVGALSAVDVDDERERMQMKPWRYGAMSVRMPLTPTVRLRRLLRARWSALELPPLDEEHEHHLANRARGRPGWIVRCTELASEACYWRSDRLLLSVLTTDTEVAVRYHSLALLRPAVFRDEPLDGV
jgi:energy-coupling factor transporter ATP-binding protein EcfA2